MIGYSYAAVFTLKNGCRNTIWPGIQPGAGKPQLMGGGIQLGPGESANISSPRGWSGRFWGRRWCSFDDSGKGTCVTGDCGGVLKCAGAGGAPPATLAEITLDSPMDFYDVSLVDGYNMPVSITPSGGSGSGSYSCKMVQCVSDLNRRCPNQLQVSTGGFLNFIFYLPFLKNLSHTPAKKSKNKNKKKKLNRFQLCNSLKKKIK